MRKVYLYAASFTAIAAVACVPAEEAAASEKIVFKDVKKNNETGQAIYSMVERGIISGYSDGTFKPNAPITYGQVAKILSGALNFTYDEIINPNYEDISPNHPNYKYIAALNNTGIFQGATAKNFKPSTVLTRGKMADILWRAYNLKGEGTTPFTDLKTKEQQRLAMLLYVNGITKGVNATQFGPNKPVTRAQLCTFIYRIEQKIASGQLQLHGPVGNLFVPADEQIISYVDVTGKEIEKQQYVFGDYIPGRKILIHKANETGRFIATTKNALGVEKQYGVVIEFRNNQYRTYSGELISPDRTIILPFQQILKEDVSVEVLSVDVNETVKDYAKRVATFGDVKIVNEKVEETTFGEYITLPIIAEGHTVIQVVYKVANEKKIKNLHLAVYKFDNRYFVTDVLNIEIVK